MSDWQTTVSVAVPEMEPGRDDLRLEQRDFDTCQAPSLPSGLLPAPSAPPAAAGSLPSLEELRRCCVRFEVLRLLGRGGAGAVFLARDRSLNRLVALKVTAPLGCESQSMARLQHPNIVQVHSERIDHRWRVICMQYVAGMTMFQLQRKLAATPAERRDGQAILSAAAEWLEERGDTGPSDGGSHRAAIGQDDAVMAGCRLGAQIADALAHAHQHGVLHRDVKPDNILIDPCGRALLTDFGLASHDSGQDGLVGGTPNYMSPEQARALHARAGGRSVNERSDIYSLGVVLYEWFTGQLPTGSMPVLRSRLAWLPRPVSDLIAGCLNPDPGQRPETAAEVASALRGCMTARRAERSMPNGGGMTRLLASSRMGGSTLITLAPHVVGAVACSTYTLSAATCLTGHQRLCLVVATLLLLVVAVPLMACWIRRSFGVVFDTGRQLDQAAAVSSRQLVDVQRCLTAAPRRAAWMACRGWLPVWVVIPLVATATGPGLTATAWVHFAGAAAVCMLTASGYTSLALHYSVIRVWRLQFWCCGEWTGGRPAGAAARGQVRLACLPPLLAAVVLLASCPPDSTTGRFAGVGLVLLGAAGIALCLHLLGLIEASQQAWAPSEDRG